MVTNEFPFTSRKLDDALSLIHKSSNELRLTKLTSYLDIESDIVGWLRTELYDKKDDFNCELSVFLCVAYVVLSSQ